MTKPVWPEWAVNSADCYQFAIACARAELEADRKLTITEKVEAADKIFPPKPGMERRQIECHTSTP